MQLRDGQLAVFEYLRNVRMEPGIKKLGAGKADQQGRECRVTKSRMTKGHS